MSTTLPLKLALVGRPNVGKSALFNRLAGRRIAIVDEAEGTTRDRLYADALFEGKNYTLIDTGGIDAQSKAQFNEEVRRQALIAIEEADVIVLVVDSQVGVTTLDLEMAKILHRSQKPLCVAVNKVDDSTHLPQLHQFWSLGITKMVPVSAAQGNGMGDLLEAAFEGLTWQDSKLSSKGIRIAIVGRPNVGKSTLINQLIGDERLCVSPIAGTTRDAVDVELNLDGKPLVLVDTAGIRRKKKEREVVDKFAAIRTEKSIDHADVCILLIDAERGLTTQDKQIADHIREAGKGCVLFFNKWDLVKGFRMEHAKKAIETVSPFLAHSPMIFGSGLTGRNIKEALEAAIGVFEASGIRISTGQLNKFVERTIQKVHPPMIQGKRLRIYYMTQVGVHPPKFILFVNSAQLMDEAWRKYLVNCFREEFGFSGAAIVMYLKSKPKTRTAPSEKVEVPSEEAVEIEEEDLDESYFA